MTRLALAALLAAAPVVAGATPLTPSLDDLNDLAVGDYLDEFESTFVPGFDLLFVASDAPRTVTATLFANATFAEGASFGFTTGDMFAAPATGSQTLREMITFNVLKGVEFKFVFAPGLSDAKFFEYSLEVSSVVTPAPVPLPAALPMIAVALGALGLVGRRRKA